MISSEPRFSRAAGLGLGTVAFIVLEAWFIRQTDFVFPWDLWSWHLPASLFAPILMIPTKPAPQELFVFRELGFLLFSSGLLAGVVIGALSVRAGKEILLGAAPAAGGAALFALIGGTVGGHGPSTQFFVLPCLVAVPYSLIGALIGWKVLTKG